MKPSLFLLFLLYSIANAKAQAIHPMNIANKLLNKLNPDYNPNQALSIYLDLATGGNAQAMNAIGMIHHFGLAGPENEQVALSWYEKAGSAGYAKGWYNAGVIYKNGLDTQDPNYIKAFDCFAKAATQNAYLGFYALGYMYYKGLGCIQSYDSAISYFRKGISRNSTGSAYMLGLCFRNGYGIPKNEDSARFWLTKASKRGYKAASLELNEEFPEFNNVIDSTQTIEANYFRAEQNVQTAQTLSKEVILTGRFKGYLIRYDYSGKNILARQSLEVSFNENQKNIKGIWIEDGTGPINISGEIRDTTFVFNNTTYFRQDHYSAGKSVPFEFRNATLQYSERNNSIYLFGYIRQFDKVRNEPEKPVYIMLEKDLSPEEEKINETNISTVPYPNPFIQHLTIDLNLKKSERVILQIISGNGINLWNKDFGQLNNGTHTLKIFPNITSGPYYLKLITGNRSINYLIIKR